MSGSAAWGIPWMARLRFAAACGLGIAPALARAFGERLPVAPFVGLGLAVALASALLLSLWRRRLVTARSLTHVQVALDLLAVTAALHLTGGVANPLLPLYSFHVVIAGILLPRAASYLYALAAIGLTLALALLEQPGRLPPAPLASLPALPAGLGSIAPVLAANAGILVALAYVASVIGAELRRRQRDLTESSRRLEDLERRKSEEMLRVGHGMLARAEDVRRSLDAVAAALPAGAGAPSKGMVARARAELESLRTLVQDAVALARIRAASQPRRAVVYLPRILYELTDRLRARAEERAVLLELRTPEHVPPLLGDARALAQAVENLVRNAISYSPPGGHVQIVLRRAHARLELSIEDQGIGISPEEMPRIFDELYRAPRARQMVREGTGLGLAIVKQVVERHGGTVEVESHEGKGSRFTIALPLPAELGTRQVELEPAPALHGQS